MSASISVSRIKFSAAAATWPNPTQAAKTTTVKPENRAATSAAFASELVDHWRYRHEGHETPRDRCPVGLQPTGLTRGECRHPSTRRWCGRAVDPGLRRGSVHYCLSSRTASFLLGRNSLRLCRCGGKDA